MSFWAMVIKVTERMEEEKTADGRNIKNNQEENIMEKTMAKEEFRKDAQETAHSIKICAAVMNAEIPGAGDLYVEVLVEEIRKLLPEKTQAEDKPRCEIGAGRAKTVVEGAVGMTFGDALVALKQGKSVARKGWNGKSQYVELASCISYKAGAGEIVNCHHNAIGNKALAFVGTSGVQMGWLASQADMLAEDWYIVD